MFVVISFILGACLGSFVNVVVFRLMANEKVNGRSHCRSCGKQLAWYHNIPLISFSWLKGKCAYCRKHISWQYPIVEFSSGALFALGAYLMPVGDWWWLVTFFILAIYSLTLFIFDFKFKILPDIVTLSGATILLLLNLIRGVSLVNLLLAAGVAAGFFALQYFISKGRWIGSGDIRLGALMGTALGWPGVLAAIVIAYWAGSLIGLLLIMFRNYGFKSEIAFGTFLTVATLVVFLWGETMLNWYMSVVS